MNNVDVMLKNQLANDLLIGPEGAVNTSVCFLNGVIEKGVRFWGIAFAKMFVGRSHSPGDQALVGCSYVRVKLITIMNVDVYIVYRTWLMGLLIKTQIVNSMATLSKLFSNTAHGNFSAASKGGIDKMLMSILRAPYGKTY